MKRVLCLFGTQSEIIKLAPVLRALTPRCDPIHVALSQHADLLAPFAQAFGVRIDHDLRVMQADQVPSEVASRVLACLDPLLATLEPDLMLVQGDTTTAMAGALAAFHRRIPIGHVEAGLRTGDLSSPFPEELNRRLITRLATLHFAPTRHNVATLLSEGVPEHAIALTGNPVVDALRETLERAEPSHELRARLAPTEGTRLLVLTTHRRESFGPVMEGNLRVLRRFVETHPDVSLAFPVHPNPQVREPTQAILAGEPRIHLLEPLGYADFLHLLARAWLIVSDSGGVQEEAHTLGKALLFLRTDTERPEAVDAGVARLVGGDPAKLEAALEELAAEDGWLRRVREIPNPFGEGDAGERIAVEVERFLAKPHGSEASSREPATRSLADFVDAAKREVVEIAPEEAHRLLGVADQGGWYFLDVREPDEYAEGHVPGARSSPRGFLEVRADLEHPKQDPWFADRDRPLLLYCGGGHRSALAAQTLQRMGFTRVASLAEGFSGWTRRSYPVER